MCSIRQGICVGSGGALRVLATPWAEVWIDGQRIDVTPFARTIPLASGTHYVTLKHPSAPVEKRQVTIVPNETLTLDVAMNLGGAAQEAPSSEPSNAPPQPSTRGTTATKGSR